MTLPKDDTVLFQLHELLVANGFAGLADALTVLLNEVMTTERSQHLQAQPYERTEVRRGYANGYKPKTVKTRAGGGNGPPMPASCPRQYLAPVPEFVIGWIAAR